MSESNVIKIHDEISTLAQLRKALDTLSKNDLVQINDNDVFTFGRTGKPLRIRLIVDKLSDKSEVYNIDIE